MLEEYSCLIEDCPHSGWFSVSCFSISSILVAHAWNFLCCSRSCLTVLATDGSLLMLEVCGWFEIFNGLKFDIPSVSKVSNSSSRILNGLKFHIPSVNKVSNSSSRLHLVSSLGWSVRSGSRRDQSVNDDYAVLAISWALAITGVTHSLSRWDRSHSFSVSA